MALIVRPTKRNWGRRVTRGDIRRWWTKTFADPLGDLRYLGFAEPDIGRWEDPEAFFMAATAGRQAFSLAATSFSLAGRHPMILPILSAQYAQPQTTGGHSSPNGWWERQPRSSNADILDKWADSAIQLSRLREIGQSPWEGCRHTEPPLPRLLPQPFVTDKDIEWSEYDRLAESIVERDEISFYAGQYPLFTAVLKIIIHDRYRLRNQELYDYSLIFHHTVRGPYATIMHFLRRYGDEPIYIADVQHWLLSRVSMLCTRATCWDDLQQAINLQLDLSSFQTTRLETCPFVFELLFRMVQSFPIKDDYHKPTGFQEAFDGRLERHLDIGRWIDALVVLGAVNTKTDNPFRESFDLPQYRFAYSTARWEATKALRTKRQTCLKDTLYELFPKVLAQLVLNHIPAELRTD